MEAVPTNFKKQINNFRPYVYYTLKCVCKDDEYHNDVQTRIFISLGLVKIKKVNYFLSSA